MPRQQRIQILAFNIGHQQPRQVVRAGNVQDRHRVGVPGQQRADAGFALERAGKRLLPGELGVHHLGHEQALGRPVAELEDRGHAADGERL